MRVKWETVVGNIFEGEVVQVEEDGDGYTADIRLDDGTVQVVPLGALQRA